MSLLDLALKDKTCVEGLRLVVYDDATSKPITRGSFVQGHPTIGYGRALDVNGITQREALTLCENDLFSDIFWATNNLGWFKTLDVTRQRAVISMIDNLGHTGFLTFKNFILHLSAHNYQEAADDLRASAAMRELPVRYEYIARLVEGDDTHAAA